jgi:Ca-activated chloride channel family protein
MLTSSCRRTLLAGLAACTLISGCSSAPEPPQHSTPPPENNSSQTGPSSPASPSLVARKLARPEMAESVAADAGAAVSSTRRALLLPPPVAQVDRERYAAFDDNPLRRAAEHPVSTFSVDVDTGAYANVRRLLNQGQLPRRDAVRVEEMINYFDYQYEAPREENRPFGLHTAIAPTPWNSRTHLLQVGIQGWRPAGPIPPANLVFLIDVSGSMNAPDKLPLLQSAMKLLVSELDARDRVSIVVYAGAAGAVLEPTPGDQRATINRAIDNLSAGGSTNGGAGIRLAYALAEQGFIEQGVNRVLLASDGDFNVGTTDFRALLDLVERKRASGVALTTLGFGSGNYNDHLVEQLSNHGNGNHAYIDNLSEARRVLVDNRAATLHTIASDVKIQIEFNPAAVSEYRLIGYENRALRREDFNNDKVDAGEIGAGHSVTALYEVAQVGDQAERMDALRYGSAASATGNPAELAFLRLRYKPAGRSRSELIEQPLLRREIRALDQAPDALRFAAAVAAFGQILRGGRHTEGYTHADVLQLAQAARGDDPDGRRGEFLQLVKLAESLTTTARSDTVPQGRVNN